MKTQNALYNDAKARFLVWRSDTPLADAPQVRSISEAKAQLDPGGQIYDMRTGVYIKPDGDRWTAEGGNGLKIDGETTAGTIHQLLAHLDSPRTTARSAAFQ